MLGSSMIFISQLVRVFESVRAAFFSKNFFLFYAEVSFTIGSVFYIAGSAMLWMSRYYARWFITAVTVISLGGVGYAGGGLFRVQNALENRRMDAWRQSATCARAPFSPLSSDDKLEP